MHISNQEEREIKEQVRKINNMLLSDDYEIRRLGKMYITSINKKYYPVGKVLLYLNSSNNDLIDKGIHLFLSCSKSATMLFKLIDLTKEMGCNIQAKDYLYVIIAHYCKIKKFAKYIDQLESLTKDIEQIEEIKINYNNKYLELKEKI